MLNSKLSHLSEIQITDLMERYYNGEKTSDLITHFKLNVLPSQLVKLFPALLTDVVCVYCHNNLIKERFSRSSYRSQNVSAYCFTCGHQDKSPCFCENCRKLDHENRLSEQRQKKIDLKEFFDYSDEDKIEWETLDPDEKIYMGSLLREGISEDYNFIRPVDSFVNPLAPTLSFSLDIVKKLAEKRAILLHESTNVDFIELTNSESGSYSYYIDKVNWQVNIKHNDMNKVPLIDFMTNPVDKNYLSVEVATELWKKIALYESIEYFVYSTKNTLGIDFSVGDKTMNTLKELLNDYSVSQMYTIIYSATTKAVRFRLEKGVSMKHAANTIIGHAQSYGERAKINKWNVQKYSRIKECPQSALSKFFFERIAKIGYAGFNECPNKELIKL